MPNWSAAFQNAGSMGASGAMTGNPYAAAGLAGYGFMTGLFADDGTVDVEKLLGKDLDKLRGRADQNAGLAEKFLSKGDDALSPALSYFQSLLSGNPAAVMAATAPARGRVIDQYDTARKAMATFAPAGGGTTGAAAASRVTQGNDLAEILSTAQDKGAAGVAQIGSTMLSAGLSTNALVSQDLNSVINAVLSGAGLSMQQQQITSANDAAQGEAMGAMLGLLLTKGKGAGKGVGTAGIGGARTPNLGAGL